MSSPPPLLSIGGGTITEYYNSTANTASSPPHHHSTVSFRNLSPSFLIIGLILTVTFIASVSLCLLLRHLNRRCLRHLSQSPSSSSSSSATVPPTESHRISSRRVAPENPTASLIDSLPLFTYSSVTRRSSSSGAADCAVCLSKFEPHDQLRLLPVCCHAFHALCVDTWLKSSQTCPLCRSSIYASEAEILKSLNVGDSFRLEVGSISRRETTISDNGDTRRSYSIGSFDYLVEDDSEIILSNAHRRSVSDQKEDSRPPVDQPAVVPEESLSAEIASGAGSGRSWLKEYIDRVSTSLSSRALSFRSSGRLFTGSSRRSEVAVTGDWDMEAARVGEEITEMFRWFSGV
ncbi:hypothetical protein FNV43_RR10804 [Rhamnella rubrinervis]|uniref:RING-type E3 ubiquitin transferase n=1 Tax=Rhamnella rubrinervis TaxID=2594499 RepID=A0A8K0MH96_9ROSA|nr:hypothetical protein FNV43_RR10804 [Rhamnella rubrinervis]